MLWIALRHYNYKGASDMTTVEYNQNTSSIEGLNQTILTKFVKVLPESKQNMVVFEFAIGWPDLAVELALPPRQFNQFCTEHKVTRLPDGPSMVQIELDRLKQQD